MVVRTIAGEWVKENTDPKGLKPSVWGRSTSAQKTAQGAYQGKRVKRRANIKDFVEEHRADVSDECIIPKMMTAQRPARVTFCGRTISAARYMALLVYGAPKIEKAVVRHLCGNGHLSCVNPAHLAWGTAADNIADAVKHRGCKTVQERIAAIMGDNT